MQFCMEQRANKMYPAYFTRATNLRLITRTTGLAIVNAVLALGAEPAHRIAHPRPEGFLSPVPVPSSLLLVMIGLGGVLAWHWWRTRSQSTTSRN